MAKTKDGDAVGVTEHDDNYLGTNPEYENSAYIGNAPVTDEVSEVEQRVRDHVEAMVQPQSEVKSFSDWATERKQGREGGGDPTLVDLEGDTVSADDAASDKAIVENPS